MVSLPEPLDGLIGMLEASAVTNFFGAPGTGKTNVCLLAAYNCIKEGGVVAYIDTEGGFSKERFRQILGGENIEKFLDKIILLEPKNFEEQAKAVRSVEKIKCDLVILDSSVALYRLEHAELKSGKALYVSPQENISAQARKYSPEISEMNREMSKQLAFLSSLARERKIPVIITAHTYKNWETGDNEIVGGDPLKYWSKTMVFIEKTSRTGERKATITKHRSQPEGKSVKFEIVEDGIKPSGFRIF